MMKEDQQWVAQVLAGDTYSFTHLVNKYKHKLCSLLVGMGNSQADAEDIAQAAFVKAYKYLKDYKEIHSFQAWLNRIAINLSISHWRKHNKIQWTELQESLVAKEPTPEVQVLNMEKKQEVTEALEQLPNHYRSVIILRYMQDMSYKEIAEALNVPVSTVQIHLYRAKQRLKELLNERRDLLELLGH